MSNLLTSYLVGNRDERHRLVGNLHLQHFIESITMNTGEPLKDVKESESRGRKNLEYSNAFEGSQISHSTQSQGKPGTGGRAVGLQELSTEYHA